jgi:hypothetical protein
MEVAWDLWEHRNRITHGNNGALVSIDINNKIRELWGDPVITKISTIRKLLKQTLDSLLGSSLETRQNWVIRVNMAWIQYKSNTEELIFAGERENMRRDKKSMLAE